MTIEGASTGKHTHLGLLEEVIWRRYGRVAVGLKGRHAPKKESSKSSPGRELDRAVAQMCLIFEATNVLATVAARA